MARVIYRLEYRDFAGRKQMREYKTSCILYAMDEAKKFVFVNRVQAAKIITPTGKRYYL